MLNAGSTTYTGTVDGVHPFRSISLPFRRAFSRHRPQSRRQGHATVSDPGRAIHHRGGPHPPSWKRLSTLKFHCLREPPGWWVWSASVMDCTTWSETVACPCLRDCGPVARKCPPEKAARSIEKDELHLPYQCRSCCPAFSMSFTGLRANETSLGTQKIPYPLRTTVLGVSVGDSDARGRRCFFETEDCSAFPEVSGRRRP